MNKKPKALFGNDVVGARLGQVRVVKRRHGSPGQSSNQSREEPPGLRPVSDRLSCWMDSFGHSFFLSAHLTSIFEARATEHSNQSPGNINTDKILVSAQSVWFLLNPQLDP